MSEKKPVPTNALVPVAFACVVVVALVLFGAPDLVLIPIAVITVVWVAVLIIRHYLNNEKKEDA